MSHHSRRRFLMTTGLAALVLMPHAVAFAQSAPAKSRAVFQVSDADPQKWNLVLNNVANAAEELGRGNVELEIVAFGPGIGMLKADSPVAKRVTDALKSGVTIVACENTMAAFKLTASDMLAGIGFVHSGVVELMKRQREGYAYIRP